MQGYAQAQNNLAVLYESGQGLTQDYGQAREWFRKAAEQGFAVAQYNLGVMCQSGLGAPTDHAEAHRWFRAAAEQDNASAQFSLGVLHEKGFGVPVDNREAVRWYRRAAENGDAAAQLNLGIMCYFNRGTPQDYVESHMWLNLAASRFLPSEAAKRERAVKNRDIVAKRMTSGQIAEAQSLARDWRPSSSARQYDVRLNSQQMGQTNGAAATSTADVPARGSSPGGAQ